MSVALPGAWGTTSRINRSGYSAAAEPGASAHIRQANSSAPTVPLELGANRRALLLAYRVSVNCPSSGNALQTKATTRPPCLLTRTWLAIRHRADARSRFAVKHPRKEPYAGKPYGHAVPKAQTSFAPLACSVSEATLAGHIAKLGVLSDWVGPASFPRLSKNGKG